MKPGLFSRALRLHTRKRENEAISRPSRVRISEPPFCETLGKWARHGCWVADDGVRESSVQESSLSATRVMQLVYDLKESFLWVVAVHFNIASLSLKQRQLPSTNIRHSYICKVEHFPLSILIPCHNGSNKWRKSDPTDPAKRCGLGGSLSGVYQIVPST